MTAPLTPDASVNTILEVPERVTLRSGTEILLNRMKTREIFKLLRIVTHGAGDKLLEMRLDPNEDMGVFVSKFTLMLMLAFPDAESETVEFIFSLAKPVGLIDRPNLSKQDKERNLQLWERLVDELENPNPFDTLTILKAVIQGEAPDLRELGKLIKELWEMIQTVGKGKVPNPPDPTSLESLATSISDRSQNSVISSSPNTQEATETTKTSLLDTPSVSFVRSPQQLLDDVS